MTSKSSPVLPAGLQIATLVGGLVMAFCIAVMPSVLLSLVFRFIPQGGAIETEWVTQICYWLSLIGACITSTVFVTNCFSSTSLKLTLFWACCLTGVALGAVVCAGGALERVLPDTIVMLGSVLATGLGLQLRDRAEQ